MARKTEKRESASRRAAVLVPLAKFVTRNQSGAAPNCALRAAALASIRRRATP